MVARSGKQRDAAIRSQTVHHRLPFGVGRGIVEPLNRITRRNHKLRLVRRYGLPDLLIHPRLRLSRPVAQQDKAQRSNAAGGHRNRDQNQESFQSQLPASIAASKCDRTLTKTAGKP